MTRRTVPVADVVEHVNRMMRTPDSTLSVASVLGTDPTPEQAFRLGLAAVLEVVLHQTGNYRGFSYADGNRGGTDSTRRRYT